MEKWIAYRHIDGHIKVRHFDREFGKELIEQLESSPFVDTYLYPYEAPNRKEAAGLVLVAQEMLAAGKAQQEQFRLIDRVDAAIAYGQAAELVNSETVKA